ncbi:hypothetical protein ACWEOW_01285 [Monashia sp. NPDC004114]
MLTQGVTAALADVQVRVQESFPFVDGTVVEAAVRVAHANVTSREGDLVPALVEYEARGRLEALVS